MNGQLLCWEHLDEIRHNGLTHLAKKCDNSRGGGRYLRLGDTSDGACVSTRTLGVWGCDSKLGALRSLLRTYLYSNQDSYYLELVLHFFVTKSLRDH